MIIKKLELQNFKNYQNLQLVFSDRVNLILGRNGMGKTNLLDAIHYVSFTKSAFGATDNQNIKESELFFLVKATLANATDEMEVICYQEERRKKIIKVDKQEIDKYADHIGKIPLVLSTPYDEDLVRDSSEVRRKWVDGCISQFDHEYLETLLAYQRVLKQRNALLKNLHGVLTGHNVSLLDTYDEQIISYSVKLGEKRKNFVEEFTPFLKANLEAIVGEKEQCTMSYKTHVLDADLANRMSTNRQKDLLMQRTSIGAHKDDFIFMFADRPLKRFGSQGQQKSFLIALRLTQYDYLAELTGSKPLLLFDDVYDKLDDERILKLTHLLTDHERFGQVFITDARKDRSRRFMKGKKAKIIEIASGQLVES